MIKVFFIYLLLISFNLFSQQEQPIHEIHEIHEEKFSNNNLKYQVTYINGIKHGKEIFWYESGIKKIGGYFD